MPTKYLLFVLHHEVLTAPGWTPKTDPAFKTRRDFIFSGIIRTNFFVDLMIRKIPYHPLIMTEAL
jgi:hypothetical protein